MKTLITLLVAAATVLIGGIGFAYSGLYNVSASAPHSGMVSWLLSTTSHASIKRHAQGLVVPDLDADHLARAGVNDFDAMCTGCHGAPGKEPAAMGRGLNPRAPDLTKSAAHMTPAELFWVTKHGIKMTGMPAWGATHDDASIWPVVAFMTRLPELDAESYASFLASAAGVGHHASEESSTADPDQGEAGSSSARDQGKPSQPSSDDHSAHDHAH